MTITVQGRECVTGPDVSNWQQTVDHAQVKAAGHSFLIAKATEGTSYVDPYFIRNRDGANAAGLVFGAYHWLKPNIDAAAQAQHFLSATSNGQGCGFVVLDAEEGGITDAQVTTWCDAVEAGSGRRPAAIYCGASTDPHTRSDRWLPRVPHLAAYPSNATNPDPSALSTPVPPAPWGRWDFWQYTSKGRCPGISGDCDLNVADAAVFARLTGQPTPTPTHTTNPEDLVPQWKIATFNSGIHAVLFLNDIAVFTHPLAPGEQDTYAKGVFGAVEGIGEHPEFAALPVI